MDVNTFVIYLHELRNQCIYTQGAFQVFNQSLEQKANNGVLFAAQAALTSASQVAAILWPPRARARRRGEVIREKLKLPDNHALGDRRFVELWDHADEKLDDWVKRTKGQQVLFDFVGTPDQLQQLQGLKEDGVYRMYDTSSKVFVFRGIGYNMENLAKAITEIGRRADMLQNQIMQSMQAQAQQAQSGAAAGQPANEGAATVEDAPSADSIEAADTGPAEENDIPSPIGEDVASDPGTDSAEKA